MGNGRCNDFANNKECGYDGGDCCAEDSKYDYCSECECILADAGIHFLEIFNKLLLIYWLHLLGNSLDILKDYIDLESKCPFGYLGLIGDGFCQTEFNIAECDFDGGDCKNGM